MAAEMEFCLLGPLLVRRDGVALPVLPGKLRVLLAALLLDANRLVSLDELSAALWGHEPPASARVTLRNYVKELRKALAGTGGAQIRSVPGGYLICVDAGQLDVSRFEDLQGSARKAAREGSWGRVAEQLRTALSLWRGEPLADVPSESLALRECPRLAEMRLQAVEARIEADLRLGCHADVIGELRRLTVAHPLRERLHALLMLALYRDGQQAEALAAYQRARGVLIGELGAEPGPELRLLEHRILTADAALTAPPLTGGRSVTDPGLPGEQRAWAVVPRQLPTAVRHFTGRAAELAALRGMLDHADGGGRTLVITAIAGTAGVGKTALAVQWAHQVADQFPDGQLYVNLRGYDPGQAVAAVDALGGLLHALGVADRHIPAEAEDRAAQYRSLLAGRRMLVLLDNAGSAEQVRPLLPGAAGSTVVVTSRDALAGLVARDGARRLDLDLLPLADAVGLLRALIGGRVDAEPEAAAALAIRCSRLPLALRVAAELAAASPAVPIAGLAVDLADQQRRLDMLDAGGDPRAAVRTVFSWSYRHLDADAARAFRLLGLHPSADFDSYGAAALTGTTIERARCLLGMLARAYLIQPARRDRYGMHDLLRAYAAEQAIRDEAEPGRRASLTCLFGHYLYTAAATMDIVFPAEHQHRPRIPPPATPIPPVTGNVAAARDWLDTHLGVLVAVAADVADGGWPGHATRLAATLFRYLDGGGHHLEALAIHGHARRAARQTGDRAAEATALIGLGIAEMRRGRWQQASSHLQQALEVFRQAGDQAGEARAVVNLGLLDYQRGRYRDAADHDQQALGLCRQIGNRTGQATALSNLGCVEQRLGRYQQAAGHLQRALALFRETGDRHGEAYALGETGNLCLRHGEYQQAAEHHRQALVLFRETGDRTGEAHTLADLGAAEHGLGRHPQAASHQRQALALVREIGEPSGEAAALNRLGELLLTTGEPGQARAQHAAALSLAGQIGDRYEQARAYNGLASTRDATGDTCGARHHWQQALTLYTGLGAPEADQIRRQLSAAPDDGRYAGRRQHGGSSG